MISDPGAAGWPGGADETAPALDVPAGPNGAGADGPGPAVAGPAAGSREEADEWRRRGRSFGAAAVDYDRGRPGYPADAVAWCLPPGSRRVLDLGAGTGKLTAAVLALGLDVVAVEPLDDMRARIPAAARSLAGGAEDIPLPAGEVDAVLVGQAFHWFDTDLALPEIARVLRSGGHLGLLWNLFDDTVPWVADLVRLVDATDRVSVSFEEPPFAATPELADLRTATFRHVQRVDADALVANIASRSQTLLAPAGERVQLLAAVRALAPTREGVFDLPWVCRVWRSRRAGAA